jgi:glycosyltransferase involved in cell wall biosynthesis
MPLDFWKLHTIFEASNVDGLPHNPYIKHRASNHRATGGDPMKVVMVITRGDDLGGAQMHVASLADGLLRAGHQVHVITGIAGMWAGTMYEAGVSIEIEEGMLREINPLRDFEAVRRLSRRFKSLQPDLVCAHSSKAGMLARAAAKLAGVPCIFTAHGWAFTEGIPQPKKAIFKTLERAMAPLATKIVCVSDYDREIAIRAGIKPARLVTIHNGVPDIDESLRARPRNGDPVRVTMVARFAEQKDQDLLIRAASDLPQIELSFVGDGPRLASAKALARSLDMESRVRFYGVQRQVAKILAESQIFVLASNFEGFPLSTLEAMRAGLPVIVSNVGGAGEAIVDGESGFLVSRGDVEILRERLALLLDKPDRRELMGNAARRRYETEFSAGTMVHRTLNLYDEAIHGGRPERTEQPRTVPPRTAVVRTSPERVP